MLCLTLHCSALGLQLRNTVQINPPHCNIMSDIRFFCYQSKMQGRVRTEAYNILLPFFIYIIKYFYQVRFEKKTNIILHVFYSFKGHVNVGQGDYISEWHYQMNLPWFRVTGSLRLQSVVKQIFFFSFFAFIMVQPIPWIMMAICELLRAGIQDCINIFKTCELDFAPYT